MKRFKYLYFTNVLNKPYFNFWFLKKLKGGEEDDGNLLTHPEGTTSSGLTWTWDELTANGVGKSTKPSSYMCTNTPLKELLTNGMSYKFEISEPVSCEIVLLLTDSTDSINLTPAPKINTGETSVSFTIPAEDATIYSNFVTQVRGIVPRQNLDITIKDIKLVKAS